MNASSDVAILGGGIIGLSIAYELATAGHSVSLYERGELGREASWAGAGIIPPGNLDYATTAIDRLRAYGAQTFPTLSNELSELTGINNGYRVNGGIEFLDADDTTTEQLWRDERLEFHRVEPNDLLPQVTQPTRTTTYCFPGVAQVRNPWHLRALIAACRLRGVRIHEYATIEAISHAHSKIVAAQLTDGLTIRAGEFVLALGAWSGPFAKSLGLFLDVKPILGQILLLDAGHYSPTHTLLVGKRYLVPRGDGLVLVGSTEEPEAGFHKRTTEHAIDALHSFAQSVVPNLAHATRITAWAGLRPGTIDGLPYLGKVPSFTNMTLAIGHGRAGVQLSCGTARVVRELIEKGRSSLMIDALGVNRVPDLTTRRAFRS